MALSETYGKRPSLTPEQRHEVDVVRLAATYENAAFAEDGTQTASLKDAVRREITAVFFGPDGDALSERVVAKNIEALQISFGSRALQMLQNVDGEKEAFQPASPEDFSRPPPTLERVFQEVFTAEIDRQIFPKDEDGQHLTKIIFDPRKITDTALKDLDMAGQIPPPGTRYLERLAHFADLIPTIKERLSHVQPLRSGPNEAKKHYRLFRIESGSHEGCLLGMQAIQGKDRITLTDLPGAMARLRHIEKGYREEQKLLASIKIDFGRIDKALVWEWDPKDAERLKAKFSSTILPHIDALKHVSDIHKKRIRKSAVKGIAMLSNNNPRAARGAMSQVGKTGIQTLVAVRRENMRRIASALRSDAMVLEDISNGEEKVFKDFYDTVEKYREKLRILNPRRKLSAEDREEICRNLRDKKAEMEAVRFEPYFTFAKALILLADRCIQELENPAVEADKTEAARHFLHLFLGSKMERFDVRLREFYDLLSQQGADPLMDTILKAKLKALKEFIFPRRVAPEIHTDVFHQIWVEVYALLKELGEKLEVLRKTTGKKDRQKIIEQMKVSIHCLPLSETLLEIAYGQVPFKANLTG